MKRNKCHQSNNDKSTGLVQNNQIKKQQRKHKEIILNEKYKRRDSSL